MKKSKVQPPFKPQTKNRDGILTPRTLEKSLRSRMQLAMGGESQNREGHQEVTESIQLLLSL